MFKGLRTIIYPSNDLAKATAWYTQVVGRPPYFNEPFYVGFNVGGFELGLLPPGDADADASPTTYWGVDDIYAEHARVVGLGAKPKNAIQDVGDGILVATVIDPFGNVVGLIQNPHFKIV
ncbi:MAG: VOC family protein [Usitatibacteraceae bacterium]